jgi:glycine betaine catabolism B
MFRTLDNFLDNVTMYRLLLYGLAALLAIALVFSGTDVLSLPVHGIALSATLLLATCWSSNMLVARLFRVPTNSESALITALILTFVFAPADTPTQAVAVGLAGLVAMASKYVVTLHRTHIFNPAAFAVFAVGLTSLSFASWWIATPVMLPFVAILGLLILRKVRRLVLAGIFIVTAVCMMLVVGTVQGTDLLLILRNAFLSWPLIFFASIMLSEPSTMPSTRYFRNLYGILVGVIFAAQLHLGPISSTPEVALLVGNLFAAIVTHKHRVRLTLLDKQEIATNIYDFRFMPDRPLPFRPGQYLEWTLSHPRTDGRGNRRTFTIASSPTEPEILLGTKFYEPSSSYKKALQAMQPDDAVFAGQLAGDFTLPRDTSRKLLFVAGGVGITPFRSIVKYLTDINQQRDIVLLYCAGTAHDVAYRAILEAARPCGVNAYYILTNEEPPTGWQGAQGMLTPELLQECVADYRQRYVYLSGPHAMVEHSRSMLKKAGIPSARIRTDHFSGY